MAKSSITPIEMAIKYREHIEFDFQLDNDFQIIRMYVQSPDIEDDLYKELGCKSFSLYISDRRGNFDAFGHLKFLNSVERHINKPHDWTYGDVSYISFGMLVVLSDYKIYLKFTEAVRAKYDELRLDIIEKIGVPFSPLYQERFAPVQDGFVGHYSDKKEELQKDILNYIPDSDKYNEVQQKIDDNQKLLDFAVSLIKQSND